LIVNTIQRSLRLMLQFHYMAPWVPTFRQCIESEMSLTESSPPFTSFQLATIDKQTGYPKNRTLIYRGFLFDDKTNNVLTFTSDKRMDKYKELLEDDKFEAVFYFVKSKKQFRFRGRARILDDTYRPEIDLSLIQPKQIIENNHKQTLKRDKQLDSDFESESDDDADIHHHHNDIVHHHKSVQLVPISTTLCSPSLISQMMNNTPDLSYTNLHDLSEFDYKPPTDQEWDQEIDRQWAGMSKSLKKAFRRPAPLSKMTDENQKLIDSISRGVDGKKDEYGRKNFAVVAMFIDRVDLFEVEKDRRCIYVKDSHQQWSEDEVCP